MSNFNVFNIKQLKQIINATGISQFIKLNVNKPQLIQQISKYIEFDGYNFTIKSTNEQKFLKSDLLKKNNKSTITAKDKKILEMTKKEVQELKEIYKKNEEQIKKLNLLTNSLKENIEEAQEEEIYPSSSSPSKGTVIGTTKKIKLKKIKEDFNKLIEEPIEDWKDIYRQYKLDSDNAIKYAKKLNPKFNAKDAFEINQEFVKIFINKYGIAPNQFLHQNRLKYDKKYAEKHYNEQKNVTELENYMRDAPLKNALKQNIFKL